MNTSNIKQLSATGDVVTVDTHLRAVVLTAAAATATVVVKAGGSGGTTVLSLSAVANTSVSVPLQDVFCDAGVHATLAGSGALASFVYA